MWVRGPALSLIASLSFKGLGCTRDGLKQQTHLVLHSFCQLDLRFWTQKFGRSTECMDVNSETFRCQMPLFGLKCHTRRRTLLSSERRGARSGDDKFGWTQCRENRRVFMSGWTEVVNEPLDLIRFHPFPRISQSRNRRSETCRVFSDPCSGRMANGGQRQPHKSQPDGAALRWRGTRGGVRC